MSFIKIKVLLNREERRNRSYEFKSIKYKAVDINGNNITGEVEGLHARIIQHEFDHLNGVLYTSRLAHKSAFGYSEEIEKFWKKNTDEEK